MAMNMAAIIFLLFSYIQMSTSCDMISNVVSVNKQKKSLENSAIVKPIKLDGNGFRKMEEDDVGTRDHDGGSGRHGNQVDASSGGGGGRGGGGGGSSGGGGRGRGGSSGGDESGESSPSRGGGGGSSSSGGFVGGMAGGSQQHKGHSNTNNPFIAALSAMTAATLVFFLAL